MAVKEREIVLDMLLRNKEGRLGHTVLRESLENLIYLDKAKRAFITRLYEGSLEKRIFLDEVVRLHSKTPLKKIKPLILTVLEMSVYQILFMDRVPDHAAINEAVTLVKKRGFVSLSGFVNGVLRNVARNKENDFLPDLEKDLKQYLHIKYSIPLSLVERLLKDYSEETEKILEAFDQEKEMTLRVNTSKTTRESLLKRLKKEGVVAEVSDIFKNSIKVKEIDSLSFLCSFEEGDFFVQDESSQLVGEISGVKEGDTVLDLCAAPGGKTALLALRTGEAGKVISCDVSDNKLSFIYDTINRLGLRQVAPKLNDATVFREEFADCADVLLCDLPCSGLGVMGKKKDIRYQVTEEKIAELARIQRTILKNAIRYVKPGGILLFSTCTMTKEENEENFRFLSEQNDLEAIDFSKSLPDAMLKLPDGERMKKETERGFLRILPHSFGSDGFFISKFIRKK